MQIAITLGYKVLQFLISICSEVSLFTINEPKRPKNEQGTLNENILKSYIMLIDKLKSQKTYALRENEK